MKTESLDSQSYCIENIDVPVNNIQNGEYDLVFEIGSKKWRACEIGYVGYPIYFRKNDEAIELQKYKEDSTWDVYYADNENLRTSFLCEDRKFIIDAVTDSYAVFGPFICLHPGSYEVIFCFTSAPACGEVIFDVVHIMDGQEEIFLKYDLSFNLENKTRFFNFQFHLQEIKSNIEFRVFSKKYFSGVFESVLLRKVENENIHLTS